MRGVGKQVDDGWGIAGAHRERVCGGCDRSHWFGLGRAGVRSDMGYENRSG